MLILVDAVFIYKVSFLFICEHLCASVDNLFLTLGH
jgi:hypothetical protein